MAAGRPSKYDEKYCAGIVEFFDRPKYSYNKKGQKEPEDIPFFSAYARSIGVCEDTMLEWVKIYPEFSEAYKVAKRLQKEFLITNGLAGLYNPTFAIFTAKNITDMRDEQYMKTEDITVKVKNFEVDTAGVEDDV